MKATKKNNNNGNRLFLLVLVAAGVMATIGALFLISTMVNYALIKDNYAYALETAYKIGWTNNLTDSANLAKEMLAQYASSNWFAGILYSLNGSLIRKLLQYAIILGTIAMAIGTFIYDAGIIYCIINMIVPRRHKKNHHSSSSHNRKSNVYPISSRSHSSSSKRNSHTA